MISGMKIVNTDAANAAEHACHKRKHEQARRRDVQISLVQHSLQVERSSEC